VPQVACPHCSQLLDAPADADGKTAQCSQCEQSFVISLPLPVTPQPKPDLVLYAAEPIPRRWSPIKIGAWIVLGCLVLGSLVMIAPQVDRFAKWAFYPDRQEDENRYQRMGNRIEAARAKSARDRSNGERNGKRC
jgi:hypothetical protein